MKKTIYLYKSGELIRKDYSLELKTKEEDIYIPIEQVNLIVCFGDITLNKRVLSLLNSYSVTMIFYNFYGTYIGRFTPKKYSDGKIIVNQVHAYDGELRLYISKRMIESESRNVLSFIKYYNKKQSGFEQEIQDIEQLIQYIDLAESVEQLMLVEARIKKEYYSCFDSVIKNKDFVFVNRGINPPLNEVNSLLSYGYALLYADVLSDIDRSPLLPQISFIHSLSKESDSLHFDIADILKPIFIDRMVIRMINRNQFNISHFEKKKGGVYLNKEGIKIYLHEYEEFMKKSVKIG
ncbi:MAG: CRISPR-associated endonuclease Cas1, partial [Erysipelotrichaceae bacterium]|nr:CRISPR-associated endonuclease Cas1 [Erysipelotrichaceae bacterium]